MKKSALTKTERLKLIGICIKSVTGIAGGSMILAEGHPYLTLAILCIGGVANEVVSFIKERENKSLISSLQETPEGKEDTNENAG